ncbi:hypothetical protein V8F33_012962, partial [Rhypophila sp. PSN 637]
MERQPALDPSASILGVPLHLSLLDNAQNPSRGGAGTSADDAILISGDDELLQNAHNEGKSGRVTGTGKRVDAGSDDTDAPEPSVSSNADPENRSPPSPMAIHTERNQRGDFRRRSGQRRPAPTSTAGAPSARSQKRRMGTNQGNINERSLLVLSWLETLSSASSGCQPEEAWLGATLLGIHDFVLDRMRALETADHSQIRVDYSHMDREKDVSEAINRSIFMWLRGTDGFPIAEQKIREHEWINNLDESDDESASPEGDGRSIGAKGNATVGSWI